MRVLEAQRRDVTGEGGTKDPSAVEVDFGLHDQRKLLFPKKPNVTNALWCDGGVSTAAFTHVAGVAADFTIEKTWNVR